MHYLSNQSKYCCKKFFPLFALLLIPTGCSLNSELTKQEFSQYVENVFRLQNQMTGEIMMLADTDMQNQYEQLLSLEHTMHQTCQPLNELAEREIDGLKTGFMLKQQVKRSVYNCEQAALKVQKLLKTF